MDRKGFEAVRQVLFVHAHPDDETLATGGLIAELVRRGVRVAVLTATRGERGDTVPGSLAGRPADELVTVRLAELAAALAALGVAEHYWLGTAPVRAPGLPDRIYQDSGMRWGTDGSAVPADDVSPQALTFAPLGESVADLRALLLVDRPELVVSYEQTGGYGHPDHVRAHQISSAAAAAAGVPFAQALPPDLALESTVRPLAVDVTAVRPVVQRALRSYRTQLESVTADHVVHVGGQRQQLLSEEYLLLPD